MRRSQPGSVSARRCTTRSTLIDSMYKRAFWVPMHSTGNHGWSARVAPVGVHVRVCPAALATHVELEERVDQPLIERPERPLVVDVDEDVVAHDRAPPDSMSSVTRSLWWNGGFEAEPAFSVEGREHVVHVEVELQTRSMWRPSRRTVPDLPRPARRSRPTPTNLRACPSPRRSRRPSRSWRMRRRPAAVRHRTPVATAADQQLDVIGRRSGPGCRARPAPARSRSPDRTSSSGRRPGTNSSKRASKRPLPPVSRSTSAWGRRQGCGLVRDGPVGDWRPERLRELAGNPPSHASACPLVRPTRSPAVRRTTIQPVVGPRRANRSP